MFCISALLLSFCENLLCLSQFIKKLNSTTGDAFSTFRRLPRVITTAHAHKMGVILHVFPRPFKQKNLRRQDPLEAILVIFARSFLKLFLFERSWENMTHDITFVSMRSSDHLGEAKMSKKRHLSSSNLTFLRITIDENGFRRMKAERQTKQCLKILNFGQGTKLRSFKV